MFDLVTAVRHWRNECARSGAFSKSVLDELEDHLVTAFEADVERGVEPSSAFELACDDIGAIVELSTEFEKVESRTWNRFLVVGWVLFVVAFFLPTHSVGFELFGKSSNIIGLIGFEAFYHCITGELGLIGIFSALTNAVMGFTFWRVAERDRQSVFMLAGVLVASAFLNMYWLVEGVSDLQIGYFAWWSSFASVATGYILRARQLAERETAVAAG